jgi:hypothetical protein
MFDIRPFVPERSKVILTVFDPSPDPRKCCRLARVSVVDNNCESAALAGLQIGNVVNTADRGSFDQVIRSFRLVSIIRGREDGQESYNDHSTLRDQQFAETLLLAIALVALGLYGIWRGLLIGIARNIPLGLTLILFCGILFDGGVFLALCCFVSL